MVQNPFHCNCHLAWFSEWLKTKGLSGSSPRCAAPARVKDVLIKELPKFEFKCLGNDKNIFLVNKPTFMHCFFDFVDENEQGCLGENYCPPKCTCTGTVVRCSRAKLKEIPRGIPPETSEL